MSAPLRDVPDSVSDGGATTNSTAGLTTVVEDVTSAGPGGLVALTDDEMLSIIQDCTPGDRGVTTWVYKRHFHNHPQVHRTEFVVVSVGRREMKIKYVDRGNTAYLPPRTGPNIPEFAILRIEKV